VGEGREESKSAEVFVLLCFSSGVVSTNVMVHSQCSLLYVCMYVCM